MATKVVYTKTKVDSLVSELNTKINNISTSTYTLPVATSSTLGGVKIGYSSTSGNRAVLLSNNKMYVQVPLYISDYVNGSIPNGPTVDIPSTSAYFYRNFYNNLSYTYSMKVLIQSQQVSKGANTITFKKSFSNAPAVFITEWGNNQPASAYSSASYVKYTTTSNCTIYSPIDEKIYVSILVIGY